MKIHLHAWVMCQSMFCALPCPWQIWDEEARPRVPAFLPLVGLVIGLLWAALCWLTQHLALPLPLQALILAVYPWKVTGGMHLDGFLDVTDAAGSCRELARRREILKDSHVGAFAVIGCGMLMLAQLACFEAAAEKLPPVLLVLLPVVSRCCSSMAVLCLRPMAVSQYAGQARHMSWCSLPLTALALALLAGFGLCGRYGLALLGVLAGYGWALRRGYWTLDGMNGDIAGYALTIGELCGVAVCALL